MEMHQVRYFLAVARHLNFTRAAEELSVTQPSLTRAIQKLEIEFEGPLFRRERANTHLTELGRVTLPHLQATYAAALAAKTQARRLKAMNGGSLSLGVCAEIDAVDIMQVTLETVDGIAGLELSVEIASLDTLETRLMSGEIDAAVMAPIEAFNDRFRLHEIRTDTLVVALARGHHLLQRDAITLEDLAAEPLIVHLESPYDDVVLSTMHERGLGRNIQHRSNDQRWTGQLVQRGLGCAVLAKAVAEAHSLPHRPLRGIELTHRTALVTVAGRRHSMVLAALIEMISENRRSKSA